MRIDSDGLIVIRKVGWGIVVCVRRKWTTRRIQRLPRESRGNRIYSSKYLLSLLGAWDFVNVREFLAAKESLSMRNCRWFSKEFLRLRFGRDFLVEESLRLLARVHNSGRWWYLWLRPELKLRFLVWQRKPSSRVLPMKNSLNNLRLVVLRCSVLEVLGHRIILALI